MLALFCFFYRCFRLFGGFFEANWFLTLIAFDKKDNAVPMQSGVRAFGRAKTNYQSTCIRDDFFAISSRSLVCRSFYSGPSVACLVRM